MQLTGGGPNYPGKGISPSMALNQFASYLTPYEKDEIKEFSTIYYVGQRCATKIEAPTGGPNNGYDTSEGEYLFKPKDHIAYRYEVIEELGSGAFGQVVKAFDYATDETVAVKIIRNQKKVLQQAEQEIQILDYINERDVNSAYGIVRMTEHFLFRNHICIGYELLGANLYDYLKGKDFFPMPLSQVRIIAARMLVSLAFMWRENIMHCDLKPENVLLRDDSSFAVKIADLGSACFDVKNSFTYIQSRFYRAPEVILEQKYGKPIDLWSFGCILCELANGDPVFPGEDEKDQLGCIMEFLGPPPESVVRASSTRRRREFFDEEFKPKSKPNKEGDIRVPNSRLLGKFLGLPEDDEFVSFLMLFLQWDPEKRATPREAMNHSWICGEFLFDEPTAPAPADSPPPEIETTPAPSEKSEEARLPVQPASRKTGTSAVAGSLTSTWNMASGWWDQRVAAPHETQATNSNSVSATASPKSTSMRSLQSNRNRNRHTTKISVIEMDDGNLRSETSLPTNRKPNPTQPATQVPSACGNDSESTKTMPATNTAASHTTTTATTTAVAVATCTVAPSSATTTATATAAAARTVASLPSTTAAAPRTVFPLPSTSTATATAAACTVAPPPSTATTTTANAATTPSTTSPTVTSRNATTSTTKPTAMSPKAVGTARSAPPGREERSLVNTKSANTPVVGGPSATDTEKSPNGTTRNGLTMKERVRELRRKYELQREAQGVKNPSNDLTAVVVLGPGPLRSKPNNSIVPPKGDRQRSDSVKQSTQSTGYSYQAPGGSGNRQNRANPRERSAPFSPKTTLSNARVGAPKDTEAGSISLRHTHKENSDDTTILSSPKTNPSLHASTRSELTNTSRRYGSTANSLPAVRDDVGSNSKIERTCTGFRPSPRGAPATTTAAMGVTASSPSKNLSVEGLKGGQQNSDQRQRQPNVAITNTGASAQAHLPPLRP